MKRRAHSKPAAQGLNTIQPPRGAVCMVLSLFATITFFFRVLAQRIKPAGLKADDWFIALALALNAYNTIAGSVFSKENKKWTTQDGLFRATTLQNRVEDLVALQNRGDFMLDEADRSALGKAFVAAMPAHDMAHPRLFRTHSAREHASGNCKIWEAARATTAAATFFKRIVIGQEEFIDAGIKCNNPAIRLLSEAQTVFGGDRPLNCLVSIGTGHPGVIGLPKPDPFQKILPTAVINVLKRIATDCEGTAHELSERFANASSSYFRFNVTHGAGSISLEE
ncbi:MAG: hypothetical protein M1826_002493 [Phylliscum demangeonii]|nr:MAG: hypothetical protein M1826_002493 [Phylliscum demangeonii]